MLLASGADWTGTNHCTICQPIEPCDNTNLNQPE